MSFPFPILALVLIVAASPSADSAEWGHGDPIPANATRERQVGEEGISELIAALDRPRFTEREEATAALIAAGAPAIEPLARHALVASPEAMRRIKTCLEQIGTQGEESTFYRAMAILTAVYGGGNDATDAQLSRLQKEWNRKRTQQAIAHLEQMGAVVDLGIPGRELDENRLVLNGFPFAEPLPESQPPRREAPRELPSPEELKSRIETVLANSLESNRRLVLGSNQDLRRQETEPQPPEMRALEQRILILGGGGNNGIRFTGLPLRRKGVEVRLGSAWKGDRSDLASLTEVNNLTHLALEGQEVNRGILERIKTLGDLQELEFCRCRFSGPALATIGLPAQVDSVRFVQQDIEVSLIERIGEGGKVVRLAFDHCDFSPAALAGLFRMKSLVDLELRGMPLDDSLFDRIAGFNELSVLRLSLCRFALDDYYRFQRSRPDVSVELIPIAFLGVRSDLTGRVNEEEFGCLISEVVADSGAEQGGIEVGDRVESLNGIPIRKFEDLRVLISQYPAGQPLQVRVERQGRIADLSVELGRYDEAPRF